MFCLANSSIPSKPSTDFHYQVIVHAGRTKTELINDKADKILKDIDKSKDYFINTLTEILENGCKGYNTMSTKALLNIYLNVKSEEDFINLIEQVSNEVNSIKMHK